MDRKPLAHAESREAKSIRYAPAEWDVIERAARRRGEDPSPFARDMSLMATMIVETPALLEAHMRALAVLRPNGLSIPA